MQQHPNVLDFRKNPFNKFCYIFYKGILKVSREILTFKIKQILNGSLDKEVGMFWIIRFILRCFSSQKSMIFILLMKNNIYFSSEAYVAHLPAFYSND